MITVRRQIKLLRSWQEEGYKDLETRVLKARRDVRRIIQDEISDRPNLALLKSQKAVYRQLSDRWESLSADIDRWALDLTGQVARRFREFAVDNIISRGGGPVKSRITKYSPEYAQRIFELIAPQNGERIAGVFTDKMDQLTLGALRQSVVSTFRQGAIEGWTSNRIHKEIQDAWGEIARDLSSEKFVDVAGRRWQNSNYLRMLTRTTTARVARESYNQTLAENGDDMIRVRAVGDNCPTCQAWDGLILSITGGNPEYPSYQQAINAGMWHPNCDCLQERIDETLDREDADEQAARKNVDWNELEQVQVYSKAVSA